MLKDLLDISLYCYSSEIRENVKNLNQTLSDIDIRNLSSIHEVEGGESLDSKEFKEKIKNRAINLSHNFQLCPGHAVILQKSNSISFFIDLLALYFLGITVIPLDPESSQLELDALIISLKPVLVLNQHDVFLADAVLNKDFEKIALILFTSGSTTRPKGVVISFLALEKKMLVFKKNITCEAIENSLCFIPTFFGHGLIGNSLFPIFFGKKFFIAKKLTMELGVGLASFLEKNGITFFSTVPAHWEILLSFGHRYKGTSLKRVHCASALLKKSKAHDIQNWLGDKVKFFDVYGATEMLSWFACSEVSTTKVQGAFDDFWDLEKNINGSSELILKADYMYEGYWENDIFIRQDHFNTGDIFQGSILSGRTKNIININGIKIQIEDVVQELMKSDLLLDSAVFPIEDIFSGERIGVFVVLKSDVSVDNLWTYCRANMNPIKIPKEVLALDKIPSNARGKTTPRDLLVIYKKTQDIELQLLGIFNEMFKTNFQDCNIARNQIPDWDSMRHAELLLKIQTRFKIKFSVKEIVKIDHLMQIKNIITQQSTKS